MEGPFVFEFEPPTEEGQAWTTTKISGRRTDGCALQMPQTLAEEQHDPPWRNQTDTYSTFKKELPSTVARLSFLILSA